ncbi:hypothetical protein JD77_05643 [Micromonospora olivasterospora]|uniref:Uncharacterized protein n=1 Tax=Micromonospora olivasterospora TaxID=1880 RepID=A0A562IIF5_MICOL|nr:hypothetical protein JD77_05643 [Micromonospora olivasterospora]
MCSEPLAPGPHPTVAMSENWTNRKRVGLALVTLSREVSHHVD